MIEIERISIVVPVYNVEQYLDECLNSLLKQTFTNFELILVDDGSKDSSSSICDSYRLKDNRIIVIHKENGGLSSARNAGIEIAKGKYITFIDSDDYVETNYLEILFNAIKRTDAQISICDFVRVVDGEKTQIKKIGNEVVSFNSDDIIKNVYKDTYHGIDFVAWAKLYRTELFTKTGIRYPEGKIHEDTFTTYKLIYEAEKISYIDCQLYFYRVREGSIMTSPFSKKEMDAIEANRQMCDYFLSKGNDEILNLAVAEYLHKVKSIMKAAVESNSNEGKAIILELQETLYEDLNRYRRYIPMRRYLYYKGLSLNPRLFLIIH